MTAIEPLAGALLAEIGPLQSVVVAFSGGVDSAVVLQAAVRSLGASRVLAITGRSPSVRTRDLDDATRVAREIGAAHRFIDTAEFDQPAYVANPPNRCYFCKTTLYAALRSVAADAGFANLVNGVNADDLRDFRPGLEAAREHAVRSPLVDCNMGKAAVRALAEHWRLSVRDKPASPCLSSRVPTGAALSPQRVRRIEAAEECLRALGIRDCRVRDHDAIARIELPAEEIARVIEPVVRAAIDRALRELGWKFVAVDLRGLVSGGLNVLNPAAASLSSGSTARE